MKYERFSKRSRTSRAKYRAARGSVHIQDARKMGREQKAGNGKSQPVPGITPALHLPGKRMEEGTPLDFDLSFCKCPCISCNLNLEALILEKIKFQCRVVWL